MDQENGDVEDRKILSPWGGGCKSAKVECKARARQGQAERRE